MSECFLLLLMFLKLVDYKLIINNMTPFGGTLENDLRETITKSIKVFEDFEEFQKSEYYHLFEKGSSIFPFLFKTYRHKIYIGVYEPKMFPPVDLFGYQCLLTRSAFRQGQTIMGSQVHRNIICVYAVYHTPANIQANSFNGCLSANMREYPEPIIDDIDG